MYSPVYLHVCFVYKRPIHRVDMCAHICIFICMRIYMHMYLYVYISRSVYMYVYKYVLCLYAQLRVYSVCSYVSLYVWICMDQSVCKMYLRVLCRSLYKSISSFRVSFSDDIMKTKHRCSATASL